MTALHIILFIACAALVLILVYRYGGRLIRKVDDCIKAFIDYRKLLVISALAFTAVAAGPRIENFNIIRENECAFVEFTLSEDGEFGNYYLTCNSPYFPMYYIPADLWIAVTRIEYVGAASYRVPYYTNFVNLPLGLLRLEKIQ